MDLQESRQLEAARQHVEKVKARARPWRAIFALVVAVIAAAVSVQARIVANLPAGARNARLLGSLGRTGNLALSYGAAVVFFLLAAVGTIGLGNKAREVLLPRLGYAHAAVVRFAIVVAGLLATIIITLQLFDIAVTQLVVGGAVTGVILGIAAQQSLANVFSGIILLSARPFRVGDRIGIRSGALSGLIEGTVTEISLTYVLLETANGPVHVPNSQVLAAAVGPAGARFHQLRVVVSNLAVLDFLTPDGAMRLRSVHPGVTVSDVVAATGFPLVIPDDVPVTRAPTPPELALIRGRLDPGARR